MKLVKVECVESRPMAVIFNSKRYLIDCINNSGRDVNRRAGLVYEWFNITIQKQERILYFNHKTKLWYIEKIEQKKIVKKHCCRFIK